MQACGCSALPALPRATRGRQKKSTDPVYFLNIRPTHYRLTHPPSDFVVLELFLFSAFWGVSRQGEFKSTIKFCLQKVHVETFSKNFDKKRFAKEIVSKSFYKTSDQKSKTDFFSIFFSARGVQKHDKKISKKQI
jgi:hypothetical protein